MPTSLPRSAKSYAKRIHSSPALDAHKVGFHPFVRSFGPLLLAGADAVSLAAGAAGSFDAVEPFEGLSISAAPALAFDWATLFLRAAHPSAFSRFCFSASATRAASASASAF